MTLAEKLLRSQSTERIDFTKYQSINQNDPLVKIISHGKIIVEPYWTLENDWEGRRYADYIASHPQYDGVYSRSELAKRLEIAASSLPEPLKLIIRASHRPIGVQRQILSDCANDYKKEHPSASEIEALEHARTFVSDPDIKLPPHVCGAAVDVCLIDAGSGQLLDFGTNINDDNEKSFLYYPNLTQTQKDNRLMLIKVMLNADMATYMAEWWHFSYGDQIWAWFYGKPNSLYSPIDL